MITRTIIGLARAAFTLFGLAGVAFAGPFSKDLVNIMNLAGCFQITYRFVEDGIHDMFSEKYGLNERVKEWIGLQEAEGPIITLPHVSITSDARAVPHWYEVWKFHSGEDAWTQEVWSRSPGDPASELRYRCTAPWRKNRWECHAGQAPKPFRDSGAPFGFNRTDYDWLDRENILLVAENGWVHNQHNKKMKGPDTVVGYELGWITYRRIDDKECKRAVDTF